MKGPAGWRSEQSIAELIDIWHPTVDWVALVQGMGLHHAVRSSTCEDLQLAVRVAPKYAYDGRSLSDHRSYTSSYTYDHIHHHI